MKMSTIFILTAIGITSLHAHDQNDHVNMAPLNHCISAGNVDGNVDVVRMLADSASGIPFDFGQNMASLAPVAMVMECMANAADDKEMQVYMTMMNIMFDSGLSPECRVMPEDDKSGRKWAPILVVATSLGLTDLVWLLLEKGADVNATNSIGCTPLMVAAMENDAATAQVLLAHGANTYLTSHSGKTAEDFAKKKRSQGVVDLLPNRKTRTLDELPAQMSFVQMSHRLPLSGLQANRESSVLPQQKR